MFETSELHCGRYNRKAEVGYMANARDFVLFTSICGVLGPHPSTYWVYYPAAGLETFI
jgi:hypothetical protein